MEQVKSIERSCRLRIMFVGDGRFSSLAQKVPHVQKTLLEYGLCEASI